jgi:hypothetical protein
MLGEPTTPLQWVNGDFDRFPFPLQLTGGRCLPMLNVSVVPKAKHKLAPNPNLLVATEVLRLG